MEGKDLEKEDEDKEIIKDEEPKLSKADLEKAVREEKAKFELEKASMQSKLDEALGKTDTLANQMAELIKQSEKEKLDKMSQDEKDKHYRDLAKKEKDEQLKKEAQERAEKDKETERAKQEAEKTLIVAKRKELAVDNEIPANLRKYVYGNTDEEILASIKEIKADYGLNEDIVSKRVQAEIEARLKGGGDKFIDSKGDTNPKLNLEDFKKMTATEKGILMTMDRVKYDLYRNMQIEERNR